MNPTEKALHNSAEEWRPVHLADYADQYSVSSHGRVRSEDREITQKNQWNSWFTYTHRGRILREFHGRRVALSHDGIVKHYSVNELVAAAWPEQDEA